MIDFTATIILDKRFLRKDDNYGVKLRVTIRRKQFYVPLPYALTEDDWAKTQVKSPRGEYKDLRFRFDDLEMTARKILEAMPTFSFEKFKKAFLNIDDEEKDVIGLINDYVDKLNREERFRTATSYITSRESFKEYALDGRKKHLPFSMITIDWLVGYEKWMLAKGNSRTSVGVYLRNLRAIYNLGIEQGYCQKDDYPFGKGKYVIPAGRKVKKALSLNDIKAYEDFKSKPNSGSGIFNTKDDPYKDLELD